MFLPVLVFSHLSHRNLRNLERKTTSFFSTQTNPVAFLSKHLRLFLFLHVFIVFVFYGSYFSMVTCNLSIITFLKNISSNSVFGDPCVGTYKYLEVAYTCQFQTVTCEGSEAELQCGEILVIHRADYGRHDQTTCSDLQPRCRLRNVLCSSPASNEVVAASCNGKNSCTISASNSVFGDPCVGTYKYLEVVYTCQYSQKCRGFFYL
uniref:SUEL-type lectin domain-containing protein n=1 Tax=Neolamprologus brichardi TaxID=32507 RepID=A0A3Q4MGL7_NEOBR